MPTYDANYANKSGKVETYVKWSPTGDKWTSAYTDGNLSMGGVFTFENENDALTHMSTGVAAVVLGKKLSEMPLLEKDSSIFA